MSVTEVGVLLTSFWEFRVVAENFKVSYIYMCVCVCVCVCVVVVVANERKQVVSLHTRKNGQHYSDLQIAFYLRNMAQGLSRNEVRS